MSTVLDRPSTAEISALAERAAALGKPLRHPSDLDPLVERIGDAHYVLLGEASHGTSEYYLWRILLTCRLIQEKGFHFVAVEGDWPDCYRVNRYVKALPDSGTSAREVLQAFERWPTWMWANWEMVAFAEWLKKYNQSREVDQRIGFYGLDVYSLWDCLASVMQYLQQRDGSSMDAAQRVLNCFEPYAEDAQQYARATLWVPESCEFDAVRLLEELRSKAPQFAGDPEGYFVAEQNALVIQNAERYNRTMVRGGPASWNVRDRHMVQTLDRLMAHHGPDARCVVWEHNTHIGDARATNMAQAGMVNVGQLVREGREREGVVLVGFGCYQGSVIAGSAWDAPMRRVNVPAAHAGSWEDVLHRSADGATPDRLLLLGGARGDSDFSAVRGHRAIGVVYEPEYERHGNYVPTVLPERYDAFLFLDETRALHPLHLSPYDGGEPPETWPWGV